MRQFNIYSYRSSPTCNHLIQLLGVGNNVVVVVNILLLAVSLKFFSLCRSIKAGRETEG